MKTKNIVFLYSQAEIGWSNIKQAVYRESTEIGQLLDKYKNVFSPELGTLKGTIAELCVNLKLKQNSSSHVWCHNYMVVP